MSFFDSKAEPVPVKANNPGTDETDWPTRTVRPTQEARGKQKLGRFWLEVFQLTASLLVPLAALISTTVTGGNGGQWWSLIAVGFGSDTIKNILVGKEEAQPSPQVSSK